MKDFLEGVILGFPWRALLEFSSSLLLGLPMTSNTCLSYQSSMNRAYGTQC
jgi:hypothetical protein